MNYKHLAKEYIIANQITDRNKITGVVIFYYLKFVENKVMTAFFPESNKYCYMTVKHQIGTVPMETIDRIADEIMNSIVSECIATEYKLCLN